MEKVNMEIKRQITDIILHEIDDPYIEFVSITRVKTTPDLKESRIYFSVLEEERAQEVSDCLNKMGGFIRRKLGKQLRIKILPSLVFIHDDSIKYSVDIHNKIEELKSHGNTEGNRHDTGE